MHSKSHNIARPCKPQGRRATHQKTIRRPSRTPKRVTSPLSQQYRSQSSYINRSRVSNLITSDISLPISSPVQQPVFIAPSFSVFRATIPAFHDKGDNRSKGPRVSKKKVEGASEKPKKELSVDEKDAKKLARLERQKKKQETRSVQLNRSSVRQDKETALKQQKVQRVHDQIVSQKLVQRTMDDKERAEYEAHHRRLIKEELEEAELQKQKQAAADPTVV